MRTPVLLRSLTLLTTALLGLVGLTGPAHAATGSTEAGCAGTGIAEISSLTFNPPSIDPGGRSTATVQVRNCTDQPLQVSSQWYGRFQGNGTAIPPGCAAIDPVGQQISLPAAGTGSASLTYFVFSGCTATSLHLSVRISGPDGTVLGEKTADLAISGSGGPSQSCSVLYVLQSEWRGGFVATVQVSNTGTVAINGWTLVFTFSGDQRVTNAWNAVLSQSGATVTARNVPSNASIPAGGSVSFGLQGSWRTNDGHPLNYVLNGVACAG
ncbi:cellulose binding domain-containing protein [Plantactinospora siamensis]|uniref:Cellulose binding domain-containing protein n=1 Tax=Plantactinospora siamensis TaxID=555372 RepID=A0ABV6P1W4_9ACTN